MLSIDEDYIERLIESTIDSLLSNTDERIARKAISKVISRKTLIKMKNKAEELGNFLIAKQTADRLKMLYGETHPVRIKEKEIDINEKIEREIDI